MDSKRFKKTAPGKLVHIPEGVVAFVPKKLPPSISMTRSLREAHDAALLALGGLGELIPFLPSPKLLINPFLRREAVLSSKIEGTQTELKQLYLFEAGEPSKPGGDAREVMNYVEALELGLDELERLPFCGRLLNNVHRKLMEGVSRGLYPTGQFRAQQNFLGKGSDIRTARFVPPPPSEVPGAMKDLDRFVNLNHGFSALIRIALAHYQFETIHPYCDGNGRVGRILIFLLLKSYGLLPEPILYLSAYFERNKDDYVTRLYEVSTRGAWEEWLIFFLQGVATESKDAVLRSRQLLTLREQWRITLQSSTRSAASLTLVDELFFIPIITVRSAADTLKMSYNGAKRVIEKLRAAGVLDNGRVASGTTYYAADQIFQILDERP